MESSFWKARDRWHLPGWILVSAALQIGFVLSLPDPAEVDSSFDALVPDRFISLLLERKPAAQAPVESAERAREAPAKKPEEKPKKKPKKKPPKPKKRPKMKQRQRLKRRKRRSKPRKEDPPPPPPAPPPPQPPPPLPRSDAPLSANGLVVDMEATVTGMTGLGTGRGAPGGVPGGTGTGPGVPGGRGRGAGGGSDAFEVDRMPLCPKLAPEYPPRARRLELEGKVVLRLHIGESGRVISVQVKRKAGNGFDEAAASAARKMRCKPAIRDGKPVAVWIDYEVEFRFVG